MQKLERMAMIEFLSTCRTTQFASSFDYSLEYISFMNIPREDSRRL